MLNLSIDFNLTHLKISEFHIKLFVYRIHLSSLNHFFDFWKLASHQKQIHNL